MKKSINLEGCINQTVAMKPVTAKEVLAITSNLASIQHWNQNGIDRMRVYFEVCSKLRIDESDLSK